MEKYIIIGDVHGKLQEYNNIVKHLENDVKSIQVGDFGIKKHHEWHLENINSDIHKINFGNHDYYPYLNLEHSLNDYTVFPNGIMTVRGADSIDKYRRTEGLDWFRNEELSYIEMGDAINAYIDSRPKIMVTHECPFDVRKHFFGFDEKNKTASGFQHMLEHHQPEIWIFGHHHKSKKEVINGTMFICLAELETYYLEL
jgi:predicted phosphodiesterase